MGLKFSQATPAGALVGTEIVPLSVAGLDRRTTTADIAGLASGLAATAELIRDTMGTALVAGTAITITVNDAGDTITVAANPALAADIWTGTSAVLIVTPDALFDAAAPVTLTDAATIAVDMATGINFNVTLGGNRTLGSPTNEKPGQSGRIRVTQDGTGGRTLAYGADWKHISATPVIDTTAGKVNIFAYFVNAVGDVELTYLGVLV